MKKFLRDRKDGLVLITAALAIIVMIIGVIAAGMYSYLKTYGYGVKELPQTLAVYFNLSKGFTVEEKEDGTSVFIGNKHPDFYGDLFKEYGYEYDRMGKSAFYEKSNNQGESSGFIIYITENNCRWFGIYEIDNGYKIEDFK